MREREHCAYFVTIVIIRVMISKEVLQVYPIKSANN